ncbi:MAG: apolipoprotein N-acyltransferase [Pseudomonadota bacterium]
MIASPARFAGLPLPARLVLIAVAGASGALAHAPYDLGPFILVPLVAAVALARGAVRVRDAFGYGLILGAGYFGLTLSWIVEPFQVDAAVTGWMAPFAAVLLALLLGSFWGAALAFARWGGTGLALVTGISGAEMLRAYVFTGFPWASAPQALVDGLAGQGLAIFGPHGMAVLMATVAVLIVQVRRAWVSAVLVLAASLLILVSPLTGPSVLTNTTVRLVQPNAPQDQKWDPQMIPVFVNRQIDFAASGPVPDLILLPETALPYLLEDAQPVFDVLADAARGAPLVLGIQRREADAYYNALVSLDATGQAQGIYDKHHLVPFGEYMPFNWFFRRIEVGGLAQRADVGYVAGPGPALLDLGPLGRALPLICYEVVFAHDVGGAPERADFLMNLTNDAWFGMRSGPQQHLAQARMRAIEQGLPMLRAANTGISAVIDPAGRVLDALPLNTAGYLDVALPAPAAPTVYAKLGDLPVALLLAGLALLTVVMRRRAPPIDAGDQGA